MGSSLWIPGTFSSSLHLLLFSETLCSLASQKESLLGTCHRVPIGFLHFVIPVQPRQWDNTFYLLLGGTPTHAY